MFPVLLVSAEAFDTQASLPHAYSAQIDQTIEMT
jgi:hypothetical protein